YFNQMAPYLSTAHVGWKVSFGKGLTGIRYAGQYYNIRQVYSPMIAIGLLSISRVTPGGDLVEPEEVSHSQSDSKHPVILDSRVPGFFWSRHAQQDTDMRPGVELSEDISQQRINALDREISHYPPHSPTKVCYVTYFRSYGGRCTLNPSSHLVLRICSPQRSTLLSVRAAL